MYVFLFISHVRRELIHFNVTASPTAAWIWIQVIEATAWGRQPQYLVHDRDNAYGDDSVWIPSVDTKPIPMDSGR